MRVISSKIHNRPDIELVIDNEMATLLFQIANYGGFTRKWPELSDLRISLRSLGVDYNPVMFQEILDIIYNAQKN